MINSVNKRETAANDIVPLVKLASHRWATAAIDAQFRRLVPVKLAGTVGASLILGSVAGTAAQLPHGFVYLADVAPTIRQDIRYSSAHNFIGRPVQGYLANECVLTDRAAAALAQVQTELATKKLSLVVWDCYRPARAVRDFRTWSQSPQDAYMKAEFFPNVDKSQFFVLGYLASRSAHSRGSTVDLGILPSKLPAPPAFDEKVPLKPCTAPKGERFEDGTIDFGTGYDCLDPLSSTASPNVPREAASNRMLLQRVMQRSGFKPYSREWWHFELADEPFPQQSFDFPIVPRGASQANIQAKDLSFRSYWTSFKDAVLKNRDSTAVANMTRFPFSKKSEEFDRDMLIADFENVFNGSVTACVAVGKPEAGPKLTSEFYRIRCAHNINDGGLIFQIINGSWRFTRIEVGGKKD